MKKVEPANVKEHRGLTNEIRNFWSRNVNAERLMGVQVSSHERGTEAYFQELETQRYRSHRHVRGWIESMHPKRSVLEVGSGVGLDTYTMACHGLQVTAVDLTSVGIATVMERFRQHVIPGRFAVADGCHLPFTGTSFDYYYSFGVLHHAANTQTAIDEAYRVLKPGGKAQIMLYHRRSLNEWVHRITGVPFEERDHVCPVVRRFSLQETRKLFSDFANVEITLAHAFGEGYGVLYRLIPQWLYDFLSRHFGWHIMILATK